MVSAPPTAAQSQAAQADVQWLSELRRWLLLGRKGVIILVRDARPPRLRELVVALDELEPGYCFIDDPADLLELETGALVLLALRREHLDGLNLNRPIFAERSLRVVLWAEGELAVQLKFLAPDLHDWISHFVSCPEGVPSFAVEGLEQGLRWRPGVAWRGAWLGLAMAKLGVVDPLELEPAQDYSSLVAALQADVGRCVIWRELGTSLELWRVRWAIAEARHVGSQVLDNPKIGAPGWYPVSSDQLGLREAAARASVSLREAALRELEPGAWVSLETDAEAIERVGLLRALGPQLRALHESGQVEAWRHQRVRDMRRRDVREQHWSRHEQAMFATRERQRRVWPAWVSVSWVGFYVEHSLLAGADDEQRSEMLRWASWMGQSDIVERWQARWEVEFDAATPFDVSMTWGGSSLSPAVDIRRQSDTYRIEQSASVCLSAALNVGWEAALAWRGLIVQIVVMGERAHAGLLDFLDQAIHSAHEQLGEGDPHYLFICRLLGLAAGAYADSERALIYLAEPGRMAEGGRYPILAGADLELSVVLAMQGRFEGALARFGRGQNPDPEHSFDRFHAYTRAALGQPSLPEGPPVWQPSAGEGLLDEIDREGRQLLRSRLMQLGKLVEGEPQSPTP